MFSQNGWWRFKGKYLYLKECSITYKLSEGYLSEAWKEKVVQCSKRRKDNLHERISSSSIQYHKNCYVTYN